MAIMQLSLLADTSSKKLTNFINARF